MDNFKLTDKGRVLLSKVVDAPLTLTNMSLGKGTLTVFNPSMTSLVSEVMKQEIERCYQEDGGIYVQAIFTNENLTTGFYVNEIGIFAIDPDEGEILYAYANTYGEQTDFFKPGLQNVILKEIIEAKIIFSNASGVMITADPSKVYATVEELNNVKIIAEQAFTQASNGKEAIKTAITGIDPTVTIPTDATFQQLADAIGQIETGVDTEDATAIAEGLLENLTAYVKGLKIIGTMPNKDGHTLNARDVINIPASGKVGLQFPDITGDYNLYAVSPDTEIEVSYGLLSDKLGIKAADIRAGTQILNRIGTFSNDTTATDPDVLAGKIYYRNGIKGIGTLVRRNSDNNGYTNMNSKEANAWATAGRIHFPILPGAYLDNGDSRDTPMGYMDDADLIPANFRADKNIFGMQGSIPVASPDYSDQIPAVGVVAGAFSGDGQQYAYMNLGLNGKYVNGIVHARSWQPDLVPANILSGKNIMGVAGNAIAGKRFATGQVTTGDIVSWYAPEQAGPYVGRKVHISQLGLSFVPSIVLLVYTSGSAGAYSTIYFRQGFYNSSYGVYTCKSDVNTQGDARFPLRPSSGDINEIVTTNFQYGVSFTFLAWE
jgi:hypothetical protein